MFLWNRSRTIWTRLLQSLPHDGRKELLELLCQGYTEERRSSVRLRRHAERTRYPQFREKLLRIAEDEERHAHWLERRIEILGGEIPGVSSLPEGTRNSWEQLHLDLDEERRCIWDLEEWLVIVERIDPVTANILRRILEEEKHHRGALVEMLMRTDPQTECSL